MPESVTVHSKGQFVHSDMNLCGVTVDQITARAVCYKQHSSIRQRRKGQCHFIALCMQL